jgi:HAD superfamily hydrolase (TIGR01509 family)
MGDPRLVIFDCDGVLVDSEPISNEVLAEALTAEGLPTTRLEALAEYKGLLLSDVVARAEDKLGHALPRGWVEGYERERIAAFRRGLRPVPDAAATVELLIAAGLAVCVASQGKLEKTRLTLGLTGLLDLFPDGALFSAYSVARGKPHPDLFLHAAGVMGVEPSRCVVVEDTPVGVTAAAGAGMRVLGYAADTNIAGASDTDTADTADTADAAELREAGAEAVLKSLAELPPLLGLDGGIACRGDVG